MYIVLNDVKVKNELFHQPFHNFLVNPLRAGLIHLSLENPISMANFPVPLF